MNVYSKERITEKTDVIGGLEVELPEKAERTKRYLKGVLRVQPLSVIMTDKI